MYLGCRHPSTNCPCLLAQVRGGSMTGHFITWISVTAMHNSSTDNRKLTVVPVTQKIYAITGYFIYA